MRFGLYTEISFTPGRRRKMFGEVLEQIEDADRLGYDVYAAIEHFFFRILDLCRPRWLCSPPPPSERSGSIFGRCCTRFRTWNPPVLASAIAVMDIVTGGRYEFGVGRGHAGFPERRASRSTNARPRYEEAVDLLFAALANERFSRDGGASRRRLARRAVPDSGFPGDPRWNVGPDLQARGRALERRRPAAAALRRAGEAAQSLSGALRQAQDDAGHRLDPRGTISTRTVTRPCARLRTGPSGSSRVTARR